MSNRDGFISGSRAERVEFFVMEAYEEICIPTIPRWEELGDDVTDIIFAAVCFGARTACVALGETSTYEDEYQALLGKLATQ